MPQPLLGRQTEQTSARSLSWSIRTLEVVFHWTSIILFFLLLLQPDCDTWHFLFPTLYRALHLGRDRNYILFIFAKGLAISLIFKVYIHEWRARCSFRLVCLDRSFSLWLVLLFLMLSLCFFWHPVFLFLLFLLAIDNQIYKLLFTAYHLLTFTLNLSVRTFQLLW